MPQELYDYSPIFIFDENVKTNWHKKQSKFKWHFLASGLSEKTVERRIAVLRSVILEEELEQFNSNRGLPTVLEGMGKFCTLNQLTHLHFKKSAEGTHFIAYLAILRNLCVTWNFVNLLDDLISYWIICDLRYTKVKFKLLKEDDMWKKKLVEIC